MESNAVTDQFLRPQRPERTRILFLARHAPDEPAYLAKSYPGDGGYPQYYHRVWQTLSALGYSVTTASDCRAVLTAGGRTDLVFSLYNRLPIDNPEILVPALCGLVGLPCVGAPANIRALAEDKWLSKLAAKAVGIPVAEGAVYADRAALAFPPAFRGPYFVKNRFGAASDGVSAESVQEDWAGARRIADRLFARGMSVLVEQYAPGIDVTVPILGAAPPILLGLVLPVSDKPGGIITEDLKRDDPLGYEMFAPGPEVEAGFRHDAARLWETAGPMDYLRMDYRYDPASGRRVFLEFNLCCHIGRSGAIGLAAAQWGASQADVLGHVVEHSLRRQRRAEA
ncbi:hypothetical protein [Azospirillum argentinense]